MGVLCCMGRVGEHCAGWFAKGRVSFVLLLLFFSLGMKWLMECVSVWLAFVSVSTLFIFIGLCACERFGLICLIFGRRNIVSKSKCVCCLLERSIATMWVDVGPVVKVS